MRTSFDILGLGCAAVDDILVVPRYPAADAKMEVRGRERHCGGLTATALVTAARLGARCAFAGTMGTDQDSKFVLEAMSRERVSLRHLVVKPGAGPVRSVIIVDPERQTRNIFFDTTLVHGAAANQPAAAVIQAARVLLVDRFGLPGMIRAALLARAAGVAVVADFESAQGAGFDTLLALVDHLIVSADFARRYTGASSPAGGVERLWESHRAAVVVTCGARGCWYRDAANPEIKHLPAFRIKAVDTTGCGDVFHGAYAVALLREASLVERLRFASAAAALKATRPGGQAGIPTREGVEMFLRRHAARHP